MATLAEMAEKLRLANPQNEPMTLRYMARVFWPDAEWLNVPSCRHNGGPKKGETVAAGMAARMGKRGLLKRPHCGLSGHNGRSAWLWKEIQKDKDCVSTI